MRIPSWATRISGPSRSGSYAIGFIVLMSLIFGILGWAVQYKLDTISAEAKIHNTNAANAGIYLCHIPHYR